MKRRRNSKRRGLFAHLVSLGFTNRLAVYLVLLLAEGLACGFSLAQKSIEYQYMGALACFTVVFTPIGTAIGIVLGKIVDKSRAENVNGNGDGITFAAAEAKGFVRDEDNANPPI